MAESIQCRPQRTLHGNRLGAARNSSSTGPAKATGRRRFAKAQTAMVLRMIPQPVEAPIRILDIGAGYGALAMAVLQRATERDRRLSRRVEAMLNLGKERNADLRDRMSFVQASLESPEWLNFVDGEFDAVISTRALHHFDDNQRRRFIFSSIRVVHVQAAVLSTPTTCAPAKELTERCRAGNEYLDHFIRRSTHAKPLLAEVRAATAPITSLTMASSRRGAAAQSSWVCRRGLFLEVCHDRSVRRI